MKVEVYVAGVSHEVWFRGSRDERQVTLLNCLDRCAHDGLKLKQTFDYTPTKDEEEEEEESIELEKLVTVQVGGWGRPLVCRLAGPLARCSDRSRFTEPEAP
ncbi:MAG: hypothetical protein ABSH34_29610 [Verrucomicrobiota bacterium]|jgi:hypothetical protein